MITLRQIKYFAAVCQTQKINDAAAELNVSASAISSAIKELQEIVGVPLLERHRRGVTPTPEGQRFLGHCITILANVSHALDEIPGNRTEITGTLRLGVTVTIAGYFLSSPISRFSRAFRNVDLLITELPRGDLEQRLIDGEIDIGLMLVGNIKRVQDLSRETLIRSPRRLWTQTGSRLSASPTVPLSALADEPYIQLLIDDAQDSTERYWARYDLKPKIRFATASVEAVRSLVASGHGVTILSDMVYRPWSLEAERIECVDLDDPVPPMEIGLAWGRRRDLSDPALAFRDYCRSEVSLRHLNTDLDNTSLKRLF